MPSHPDRVRKHYDDLDFIDCYTDKIFHLFRGITVGFANGQMLKVSRRYLRSWGMNPSAIDALPRFSQFLVD